MTLVLAHPPCLLGLCSGLGLSAVVGVGFLGLSGVAEQAGALVRELPLRQPPSRSAQGLESPEHPCVDSGRAIGQREAKPE